MPSTDAVNIFISQIRNENCLHEQFPLYKSLPFVEVVQVNSAAVQDKKSSAAAATHSEQKAPEPQTEPSAVPTAAAAATATDLLTAEDEAYIAEHAEDAAHEIQLRQQRQEMRLAQRRAVSERKAQEDSWRQAAKASDSADNDGKNPLAGRKDAAQRAAEREARLAEKDRMHPERNRLRERSAGIQDKVQRLNQLRKQTEAKAAVTEEQFRIEWLKKTSNQVQHSKLMRCCLALISAVDELIGSKPILESPLLLCRITAMFRLSPPRARAALRYVSQLFGLFQVLPLTSDPHPFPSFLPLLLLSFSS